MFKSSRKRRTLRKTLAGAMSLALLLGNLYAFPVLAETSDDEAGGAVTAGEVIANDENAPAQEVLAGDENGGAPGEVTDEGTPVADESAGENGDADPEAGINLLSLDDGIAPLSDGGHEMDIAGMTEFSKDKTAGTEIEDSTGYFTLICHANTVIKAASHTFDDGVSTTKRIELGGQGKTTAASVKFTTTAAAEVEVHWMCAGDGRQIVILDASGSQVAISNAENPIKNDLLVSTFSLDAAGTYYIGSNSSSNTICALKVTEENSAPAAEEKHSMDIAGMTEFSKDKTAGTEIEDSTGYFTLICHANTVIKAASHTFDDGVSTTKRIELGGQGKTTAASIKFTTTAAAEVEVHWMCAGDGRQIVILDASGSQVAISNAENPIKNDLLVSTFSLDTAGTYYIGSNSSSNTICALDVTQEGGSAVKTSVTPSITGLTSGQTVALVKGGREIEITDNTAVELETGTYNLIVKKNGSEDTDFRATVNQKTTVQIKEDTTAIEVVVSDAYVNPTVRLAAGSLELASGNALTLTKKGESAGSTLTVGSAVKLKIDETYTLATASGSKTKATIMVSGKAVSEFKATADMKDELSIMIEPTVVNAAVQIFDPDSVKGQVTALNLKKGSSVVADLLTASAVELTIGESYTVEMQTEATDLTVSINNGTTVKADAGTTELKVLLGKVSEGLYVIDLTKGLYKNQAYDGGISVMADMPYSSSGYVKGSVNPKNAAGKSPTGEVPVLGTVLVLTAEQDGRLKVSVDKASGKTFYFVTESGVIDSFIPETATTVSYNVEEGTTYYFYGSGSNMQLTALTVDYRPAVDWSTVEAPVLQVPVAAKPGDADEGTVTLGFAAKVGGIYSDALEVRVYKNDVLINTVTVTDETSVLDAYAGIAKVVPAASGDYTFQAALKRSGEQAKLSNVVSLTGFQLPMATPVIVNAESQGSGNVKFSWQAVPEAATYKVYLNGDYVDTTSNLYYRFSGLTAGTEYEFAVEAVGNGDVSERSAQKATVTGDAKKNWLFSAFGQGASSKNSENGYSGSLDTQDLSVWSLNNKGKLVPASTDGLSFYYTTIDPDTENFTLTADVTVDSWTYTNGQEGFGLMAADTVGTHGNSSVFWNNSYMLSVTKVEYTWNPVLMELSDGGTKYTMRLGVGAQEKTGVTPENLPSMQDGTGLSEFTTNMYTLENSAALTLANDGINEYLPSGSYNMVGNYTNTTLDYPETDAGLQTTFHMVLQRNNTGYFLSYTDPNGVTTTKKFYHGDEGDELAKLDPNNIYVGFFASRTANISIKNATLTTIAPENDAPAEERPIEYVTPKVGFESAKVANSYDYELVYYGNVDGKLYIETEGGDVIANFIDVKAEQKYRFDTQVGIGETVFRGYFQPDLNYRPSKYAELLSYEPIDFSIKVKHEESVRNIYYVSPENQYWGTGDKDNPMDIYTAISRVAPGDTIVLMEGTYSLNRTITIDRGVSGTADAKIYMIADPEAASRPVLDFNKQCPGMVMAGDYWYFQGFDVTRSSAGDKGVQVSGSYNVLDNLMTYRNGNTGIQISRFKATDLWEDWPSNNLILNCTSYLNADPGYEDADGFAAKLTIADGNVFDGCIAAYNADDGWDLFAKIESGPIGRVEIRNSVAFKNGYDIGADGQEIVAGNGNGFKMGGSSISGYHTLRNSVAFGNRAKGIDSNSCPDIQAYNSISFNNESYNVAFYTNDAKNTDFAADGIVSYKTSAVSGSAYTTGENLKLLGTQDDSKVKGKTNYYWNGTKSVNTAKVEVTDGWFVSLDMDQAIHGGICRNADGTINMNGFLELTSAAPEDAGARMTGTASEEVKLPELVTKDDGSDDDEAGVSAGTPAEETPAQPAAPEKKPGKTPADKKPAASTEGGNSGSGNSGNGNTGSTTKKLVIDKDADWSEVDAALKELEKSAKGDAVLDVTLGAYKELEKDIVSLLKGKKITLHLNLQNGAAWNILGEDVKEAKKVNMNVTLNTKNIPQDKLDDLAQGLDMITFSLDHEGDFGFTAKLIFPVGSKYNGKFANLFYYNNGDFEYQSSSEVKDGKAEFDFSHASDYVILVSDTALSGAPEKKAPAEPAVTDPNTKPETNPTPDEALASATVATASSSGSILPIILIIIAVVIVAGIAVAVVMNRKKED